MTTDPNDKRSTAGFTLIEVALVLAILAALSAAAAFLLRPALASAEINAALSRFQAFDHLLREEAQTRQRRLTLTIENSSGKLECADSRLLERLERRWPIRQVVLPEAPMAGRRVRIDYFPDGSSRSFALEFSKHGQSRWIVICGGTGQVLNDDNENHLKALLRVLAGQ